ncbi:NYN domain-containing protein [Ferruginivarius sediminum]|uniref:NYN domain-containing protein n=2 Tax=Ferruginivarius sediminum TaxID=2661937 RepID=A0A369T791_9PROT|nr:NYN domain-containing protein [Ferruginivarius sediminum]RDD60334.1 NYN domain-containing protein [Ferruginivarius sediminum]
MQARQVIVLIDGGHLRKCAEDAGYRYNPNFIEKVAKRCANQDEEIVRILYYDCAPFTGKVRQPVSGREKEFNGSDRWLHDLARRELFAVRRGVLKFRGWRPKEIPIQGAELSDEDFLPVFEQKGVDMRIGLDLAEYARKSFVSRVLVVGADTDLIPALKFARLNGLQVVGILLPEHRTRWEYLAHVDIPRQINFPEKPKVDKKARASRATEVVIADPASALADGDDFKVEETSAGPINET